MKHVLITVVRNIPQPTGNVAQVENTKVLPEGATLAEVYEFLDALRVNKCTLTFETKNPEVQG